MLNTFLHFMQMHHWRLKMQKNYVFNNVKKKNQIPFFLKLDSLCSTQEIS